ncbi:MAG: hypothetical protein GY820_10440 [Gammaproteobacteria bacterium]|nr:hypothetical protein [Gammaproteobacteria bacterium]
MVRNGGTYTSVTFFSRQDKGRIYVLRMDLPDGTSVHKIGMVNTPRSTDRMMELIRSWFVKYRFIPYTELRLDLDTPYPVELESHIHRILDHKRFTPNEKVEGRTEMFTDLDELRVLQYLKVFNNDLIKHGLDLTDEDYKNLGQLISP